MLLKGPAEARHLSKHGLEALDDVRVRGRGCRLGIACKTVGYPYISVGVEFPL